MPSFRIRRTLVTVQNYFQENNTAYFVMEYVEGVNLKTYLSSQGGRVSWERALELLVPVMKALTQVHAQNILHRDISPDNICITPGGESPPAGFRRGACHPGRREKRIGHPEARICAGGTVFQPWQSGSLDGCLRYGARRCTAASPAFCRRTRWSGCTAIR